MPQMIRQEQRDRKVPCPGRHGALPVRNDKGTDTATDAGLRLHAADLRRSHRGRHCLLLERWHKTTGGSGRIDRVVDSTGFFIENPEVANLPAFTADPERLKGRDQATELAD